MFLGLFALWLIFNGRIDLELVIIGLMGAGLIMLFLVRVMGYEIATERRIYRNIPWAIVYVANLVKEVVKAAMDVMEVSFNKNLKPDPVIVEFHSGLEQEIQNVFLANSITLTPGTITVFQEGDFFVIHCLRGEYAQGIEDSSFIRLLSRMHW